MPGFPFLLFDFVVPDYQLQALILSLEQCETCTLIL
jgi:hypothetical protein